ncbi:hypothetical protein [Nocardioides pakistanensis]
MSAPRARIVPLTVALLVPLLAAACGLGPAAPDDTRAASASTQVHVATEADRLEATCLDVFATPSDPADRAMLATSRIAAAPYVAAGKAQAARALRAADTAVSGLRSVAARSESRSAAAMITRHADAVAAATTAYQHGDAPDADAVRDSGARLVKTCEPYIERSRG